MNAIKHLQNARNSWLYKCEHTKKGDQKIIWNRMYQIANDQFIGDPNCGYKCPVCNIHVRGWIYGDYSICLDCGTISRRSRDAESRLIFSPISDTDGPITEAGQALLIATALVGLGALAIYIIFAPIFKALFAGLF